VIGDPCRFIRQGKEFGGEKAARRKRFLCDRRPLPVYPAGEGVRRLETGSEKEKKASRALRASF
jgi:hypothetical protein